MFIVDTHTQLYENMKKHIEIVDLYGKIVEHLRQIYCITEEEMESAIKVLVRNYSGMVGGRMPEEVDYNQIANCLGYLHRYAACHSALAEERFFNFLQTRSELALQNKFELSIVSLGGGCGNDLIGCAQALLAKNPGHALRLNITVIDKMSGWKEVFLETVKFWNKQLILNVPMVVTPSFIEADLRKAYSSKVKKALENADVLLMVKFLSCQPDEEKIAILQNLVQYMSSQSFLIFIDWPLPPVFAQTESLKEIYCYNDCQRFVLLHTTTRYGYKTNNFSSSVTKVFVKPNVN